MNTNRNYICPSCGENGPMNLFLAQKGQHQGNYFYVCQNNSCKFYLNTNLSTSHDIFEIFSNHGSFEYGHPFFACKKNKEYMKIKNDVWCNYMLTCPDCINVVRIVSLDIFIHFIDCTLACHVAIFRNLIRPYFNSIEILKFILKQNAITNVYPNMNEYKMFNDLHQCLLLIKNPEIVDFVTHNFGDIQLNQNSFHGTNYCEL